MAFKGKGSTDQNPTNDSSAVPEALGNADDTALERVISKDQFAGLASFDDALALMQEAYGAVSKSDEFGDGFEILEEKRRLVGVPFAILDSSLHESKEITRNGVPATFSVLRVMTQDGKKFVVTDGSTGMHQDIQAWRAKTGRRGGFVAMKGLRVSDYDYTDNEGNTTKASTFYLDESGV